MDILIKKRNICDISADVFDFGMNPHILRTNVPAFDDLYNMAKAVYKWPREEREVKNGDKKDGEEKDGEEEDGEEEDGKEEEEGYEEEEEEEV